MQHPAESSAAKNTVRLAQLCLPKLKVYVGEMPDDFASLRGLSPQGTVLLYPGEHCQALESSPDCINFSSLNIIVLDGTWKKVHRLLMLNPWLQQFPAVSFAEARDSQYLIRQSSRVNGLSSIEAIAYSLELIEGINVQPLHDILAHFVKRHQSFQSK